MCRIEAFRMMVGVKPNMKTDLYFQDFFSDLKETRIFSRILGVILKEGS